MVSATIPQHHLYGHGQLSHQLLQSGVVDEVRIGIFPLVLGRGRPVFLAAQSPVAMKLVDIRKSQTGVVHLIYGK
ncbi:dihydrofolate reductase family protein [Nocardia fusca]|uniref:dihydrofolate reductase family protein n=1 Tax=Nocardia fusca TaxID=941183 RepID=UPI0037C98D09